MLHAFSNRMLQSTFKGSFKFTNMHFFKMVLVYVIAWIAIMIVFGINCMSNVGKNLVTMQGAAEPYFRFPAYITRASNSKYYGKSCYYKLIQYALPEPCYHSVCH